MRRLLAIAALSATCIWPAAAGASAPEGVALSSGPITDGETVIVEIPRPASAPLPTPPPTPRPLAGANRPGAGTAGHLSFAVQFDGTSRNYSTSLSGSGGQIRGSLSSYGFDNVGVPVGIVTLGSRRNQASIGSLNDPYSGTIIRGGVLNGIDLHHGGATSNLDAYSGRLFDGTSLLALARTRGNTTDTIGVLGNGPNRFGSALLRHDVLSSTSWGTLEQEVLVGSQGVGAGLQARTRGRTFLDASLTSAVGRLPLADGDLPASLAVGRYLGNATTVLAGFGEARGEPASAFVAVSTRVRNVTFAANASLHNTNAFVSASGNNSYAQLYMSTGSTSVFGARGGVMLRAAQFDFDGSRSNGSTVGYAQFRTTHAGLNIAAGVDSNNGPLRPLLGVVAAVTPALGLETALVAGTSGRPALRIAFVAGFQGRAPRVATFPLAISVDNPPAGAPLRLFVDGAPRGLIRDGRASVSVTAGTHDIYVKSADGALGSPQRQIVAGVDRAAAVGLVPLTSIHGRVRFAASPGQLPPKETLDGVRVVLVPSGVSVVCDADGVFVFPRAPYDPQSTMLVDPETLPPGFAAPEPIAIGGADLDVPLAPARRTERQIFR